VGGHGGEGIVILWMIGMMNKMTFENMMTCVASMLMTTMTFVSGFQMGGGGNW
jgi:hypothetical protein